ncbi:hypothetical protein MYK68_05270 [Gordonia sp. PP30]|uniref:hypothetical protein n=1 Tax=unclassified Gordonia (in: high G+C Gram-positive bacteria) TaxID=2657482 RepID=UPI001FFFBD67|nr:hypothetical protein [Gordonia sp. PP30]UQE76008.1 hypothetical protein MYK68_05270 [Gordonia sp. PP30]
MANPLNDRPGRERQRLRKLAQAAMNADQTVDQVEGILGDMGPVLEGLSTTVASLDGSIDSLDVTLERLNTSLDNVDSTVNRMAGVVTRLERIVTQVEGLVAIAETALRPISAVESAAHGVAGLLGFGGKTSRPPRPALPVRDQSTPGVGT